MPLAALPASKKRKEKTWADLKAFPFSGLVASVFFLPNAGRQLWHLFYRQGNTPREAGFQ